MWRRLVPLIKKDKLANNMDRTIVESFCINYQMLRDAYDDLYGKNGDGVVYWEITYLQDNSGKIVGENKVKKKNPSVSIINQATATLKQLGNELGLTPKSRNDLMALRDNEKDDNNQLAEIYKVFGDGN